MIANWQILPNYETPVWLRDRVGNFAAQLLWQRGIRDSDRLEAFLSPAAYQPTSAFAFGDEMQQAIVRLQSARANGERVAIWGDFDADGVTATAVLWEGLGEFFPQNEKLTYYIPDRLTAAHGLSMMGIDLLQEWFGKNSETSRGLIVTCDTGSTNLDEILYARSLGIDIIVTDHHTLPAERPPVVAIVNPRYLPAEHPLYHLSGVAVAYKLIEALYESLPNVPQHPIEDLLDLVAIGLVADLVQLVGDCRYLAQRGIEVLKRKSRLGVKFLLEQCKKAGDRPTDISFGIAPRINSVSRIWGDVRKCVELLTSQDEARCQELVKLAELANTQRKALQKRIFAEVKTKLDRIDLSTTGVLVLDDPQWSVGILGLVAGQVAGEYGRPVLLFAIEAVDGKNVAKGSARSPAGIDLYELIKGQEHLLLSFGGHPLAAGLSLPAENLPLLREALNQQFWVQYDLSPNAQDGQRKAIGSSLQIDLIVKIADLGQQLFRQLKLLEPYGMGNPAPKLLIQNCHFEDKFNANIKNLRGQKVEYIKSDFLLVDETGQIRGDWWGHYSYEIPDRICDVVVELIDNSFRKTYEVRIIDIRAREVDAQAVVPTGLESEFSKHTHSQPHPDEPSDRPKALIYARGDDGVAIAGGNEAWRMLVGIAKYLDRTGKIIPLAQLQSELGIGDRRILQVGLSALQDCGWQVNLLAGDRLEISRNSSNRTASPIARESDILAKTAWRFIAIVNELAFQQKYFEHLAIALSEIPPLAGTKIR
jgi:single-stranded-DNA-specific exonuclease